MNFQRFAENPLLRPSDLQPSDAALQIECLLNPGVFRFNDKICLLVRVAERPPQQAGKTSFPVLDHQGNMVMLYFDHQDPDLDLSDVRLVNYKGTTYLSTISHLRLLMSDDGVHFYEPEEPVILKGEGPGETFGIEDCRVSYIDQRYYLTYSAVSENGVAVGMRSTADWKSFEHHGIILPPHNKDCALFEERINGQYYCLHRPSGVDIGGNYIWLASSPDLIHWGKHQCIARTRPGQWDSQRIGAGCAPVKTEKGWLQIYHGADDNSRYALGALLLDLEDPSIVLARSEQPLAIPEEEYETQGFFGQVIFTNGHIVDDDTITIYYGAADEVICAGKLSVKNILQSL